jgi:two-component system, OmpR family, response regulator
MILRYLYKKIRIKMAKALIIDDEIDICYLLGSMLRTKHLEVSYVNSLMEATTLLKTETPEIIFIDNHLPDGLGVDFIRQLKLSHPSTKVVMITAFDNYSDRLKALTNGADTFVPKPFTKDIIYKTIDSLVAL